MNENQPLATKRPEPPAPGTPKRLPINIPPWALFAGYGVLIVLAAIAGYAYNDSRGSDRVPNYQAEVPPPTDFGKPFPESASSDGSAEEHEADSSAETIKVTWQKPYELTGPDFFDANNWVEDGQVIGRVTYYQVGRVEEGPYQNHSVFVVLMPCVGLCSSDGPMYRFLWDGMSQKAYLLARYSPKQIDYAPKGNYMILENVRIPELELPLTFKGPQGQELKRFAWMDVWFDVAGRSFAFHDKKLGDVFLSRDGGYYLRAADGTDVLYTVPVPFMEETTVPRVTWNDGTANTYDYSYMDYGGCGSRNLASVLSNDVLQSNGLIPAGRTPTGDPVYFFRDPRHPLMQAVYDAGYGVSNYETGEKMSYEEFVASKPVFVWKDPFNRLIKFQRTSFQLQAECGKPVIYLYPEKKTEVSVRVEPKGGMTVSDPPYDGGWKVIAEPDGTLTNLKDNATYPYLFWEGRGGLYETPKQGHIVARGDIPKFVDAQLRAHGLNDKEIADFAEFWLPRMTAKPYYFVTFLTTQAMDELAPLTVEPKPETVFRILMDYLPLDAPIAVMPPPKPRPIVRNGFTVIEWGGVLGRE